VELELKNVSFRYFPAADYALLGVDLSLGEGETVCLVGPNGSGKSTLLRIIAGLLSPSEGAILLNGRTATREELRGLVGYVFQNPENQIVGSTVIEDVVFGLENLGIPRKEMLRRAKKALECVRLHGLENRAPGTLSGGQKQRLALASILAMEPRFLALDEPTSMIDLKGKNEVLLVLEELRRSGHGIVLATHDPGEMSLCDRIVLLDEGEMVASIEGPGPWVKLYDEFFPESFEFRLLKRCKANPLSLKRVIQFADRF